MEDERTIRKRSIKSSAASATARTQIKGENSMNDQTGTQLQTTNADLMVALKSSVYPGAKDESIALVMAYCRAANLDPLQKPVHIVPMSVKEGKDKDGKDHYVYRDVIMPGINLYRVQAARTRAYAGISEPEFGPAITAQLGITKITYPEWCKVTVRRIVKDKMCEFSAMEFWLENYATKARDNPTPNTMWTKRPYGQLAKCTSAQALRQGFPEITGAPTAEEMEGKIIDHDTGEIIGSPPKKDTVKTPGRKTKEGAAPPSNEGPKPEDTLSENMLKQVRAHLGRQEVITEEGLLHLFEVGSLEELKASDINDVLAAIHFRGGE
jgi:phage recombination protein Bet